MAESVILSQGIRISSRMFTLLQRVMAMCPSSHVSQDKFSSESVTSPSYKITQAQC